MPIQEINPANPNSGNKKFMDTLINFNEFINELNKKEIPVLLQRVINEEIQTLSSIIDSEEELYQKLRKVQSHILSLVEKELQFVPKYHYRNRWLALGLTAFGIPIGLAIGLSFGNMAFLGIGLPIGLLIGVAVGSAKDKKAKQEGKQLDFVIK